jgi:hypothetical protein
VLGWTGPAFECGIDLGYCEVILYTYATF